MKPRHHLYLDEELSRRLDALADKPGGSKSAIVADALRAFLDREGARELDTLLGVRLDRFAKQLGRIERDVAIVMESLALFIRYEFSLTPPLPEADQVSQHALARDRYEAFIQQVGRRLAAGRSVVQDVTSTSQAEAAE